MSAVLYRRGVRPNTLLKAEIPVTLATLRRRTLKALKAARAAHRAAYLAGALYEEARYRESMASREAADQARREEDTP